jgi:hypothetical protein
VNESTAHRPDRQRPGKVVGVSGGDSEQGEWSGDVAGHVGIGRRRCWCVSKLQGRQMASARSQTANERIPPKVHQAKGTIQISRWVKNIIHRHKFGPDAAESKVLQYHLFNKGPELLLTRLILFLPTVDQLMFIGIDVQLSIEDLHTGDRGQPPQYYSGQNQTRCRPEHLSTSRSTDGPTDQNVDPISNTTSKR